MADTSNTHAINTLYRDKDYIAKQLYVEDNKIYTKSKLIIEFPKWYEDKKLLDMQEINYLYGIFALIVDNKYSISVIPTLINTVPIAISEVDRNGEPYTQFIYGKDSCIVENLSVVKRELLSYDFFENFIIQAKIPWFIQYEDIIRITDNLAKYAKSNLGENYIASELVVSFIARAKENKSMFYRQNLKSDIYYVDLMNVYYSALSSLNKISGNYFKESIVSALVQKEKEPTKLEDLVRM